VGSIGGRFITIRCDSYNYLNMLIRISELQIIQYHSNCNCLEDQSHQKWLHSKGFGIKIGNVWSECMLISVVKVRKAQLWFQQPFRRDIDSLYFNTFRLPPPGPTEAILTQFLYWMKQEPILCQLTVQLSQTFNFLHLSYRLAIPICLAHCVHNYRSQSTSSELTVFPIRMRLVAISS